MRQNLMQLCGCLMLLLSVAWAGLVETQDGSYKRAPSLTYKGSRLRCFQYENTRIVQPFIAMQVAKRSFVRRDPLGNGFYFTVPLKITSSMRLPTTPHRQWHMMKVNRFKVQLRQAPCRSRCPKVAVMSEWRRGNSPLVRFRCDKRRACQRLLRSLRFKGERSRSLRGSLRFTFFGQANGMQFAMSRVGLPVSSAATRPYPKEFWFEGDKLMLFTIKANIGVKAFETFQSDQTYAIPRNGGLPPVYRSHLVDQLSTVASTAKWEIVAEMRKGGRVVSQAVFNGNPSGLNKNSWFTAQRLVSSKPYWAGRSGFNYFSIAGHAVGTVRRRFFINKKYGGCPHDVGVFSVSDSKDPCPWSNQFWKGKAPVLIYSAYDNVKYQSGSAHAADNFLIYMRLARSSSSPGPVMSGVFNFEKNKILLFTVTANSNNVASAIFLNSARKDAAPKNGKMPTLFRSELIDSLGTVYARTGKHYIVAEMRAGARMVSQVKFDISSRRSLLNKENWFARDRVVSSYPYAVGNTFNYFSIRGDAAATVKRSFFISFNYGGCHIDRAFWVVSEHRDPCVWGHRHWSGRSPALIYTKSRGPTLQSGGAQYDANRFLVYLE